MDQGRQQEIDVWEQKISELQTFSFQKEKTEDSKMEQKEQEPNQDIKLSDANAGNILSKLGNSTVWNQTGWRLQFQKWRIPNILLVILKMELWRNVTMGSIHFSKFLLHLRKPEIL